MNKDELIKQKLEEIAALKYEIAEDIPLKGKATYKGDAFKGLPDSKLRELVVILTMFIEKHMLIFPDHIPYYDLEDANILLHNCNAVLKNREMDNKRNELCNLESSFKKFVSEDFKLTELVNQLDSIKIN